MNCKTKRPADPYFSSSLAIALTCLLGCALWSMSGCGKKGSDESLKGPATAEEAASVLDF